jgi:hypothetical protein
MKIVETLEGAGVAATLIMRDFISRRDSFSVNQPGLVRGHICWQLPSFIGHDRCRAVSHWLETETAPVLRL